MGAPQVGHETTTGAGVLTAGVLKTPGCRVTMSRRKVLVGMAQRVFMKPKCRTFMKPSGRTCWRKRRINLMASRWGVRGLALPGLRDVKVTVRSVWETRRRLEMATLTT